MFSSYTNNSIQDYVTCGRCNDISIVTHAHPSAFKIQSIEQVGSNTVAIILFTGCINKESTMICVFKNTAENQITSAKELNPNFGSHKLAPFARFTPSKEGLEAAMKLAKIL